MKTMNQQAVVWAAQKFFPHLPLTHAVNCVLAVIESHNRQQCNEDESKK